MNLDNSISPGNLRLGGISGIIIGFFLIGVVFQISSGWFPEEALQKGEMTDWLKTVATNKSTAYIGISISILCIILFLPFGLTVYKLLPADSWLNTAAISIYTIGASLSLAAFTLGFAFTWGLIDVVKTTSGEELNNLSVVATMGMRGFLWTDDLATSLLGTGHLLFSVEGLRSKRLPKFICYWGIAGGVLVILVIFRYLAPILVFTSIGYAVFTLWWVFAGIFLLRKAKKITHETN